MFDIINPIIYCFNCYTYYELVIILKELNNENIVTK